MSVPTLDVGIGDLVFFKDLALFLSRCSYETGLNCKRHSPGPPPVPLPTIAGESLGPGSHFDTLSAHESAWCRVIVELPHHKGGLGITPLPASGMAAFYSATAQLVSWLCSEVTPACLRMGCWSESCRSHHLDELMLQRVVCAEAVSIS